MADRFARSRAPQIQTTDRPTVRDQAVERAVPIEKGPGPEAFAGLKDSLGAFFQQTSLAGLELFKAAQTVEAIEQHQDLKDHAVAAQQQRADLSTRGQLDAQLERPQDPEKAVFRDYGDAYQSTLGTNSGLKAAQKWREEVLLQMGVGGNIDAVTEEWIKTNLQPTGNDVRDLYEAATFRKAIGEQISKHKVDQIRAQREAGLVSAQTALIGRLNVDGVNPTLVQNYMDLFRQLDPMAPQAAPGRVVAALMDWAQANPKRASEVDRLLRTPGLGPNGSAMIDMPGVADQSLKLVGLHQNAVTLEGAKAYNDLQDKLKDLNTPESLYDFEVALERTRETHGGDAKYQTLKNQWKASVDKFLRAYTEVQRVEAMADGRLPTDPSEIRKGFAGLLQRRGLDLAKNPIEVAQLVTRLGEADDTTKHAYSQWMLNPADPEKRMAALAFWGAVEGRLGSDAVTAMLPSSSQGFYLAYRDLSRSNPGAATSILQQLDANADILKDASKISWSRVLTGYSTDKDAEVAADKRIKSALGELDPGMFINGTVRVDEVALRDLRDSLRTQLILRGRAGGNIDGDLIKEIVRGQLTAGRFEAIPGEDGKLTLHSAERMNSVPNRVGFGTHVYNPLTKQTESTVDTYREDLGTFAKGAPGLFGSGISINPNDRVLSTHGVYGVQKNGMPVFLAPGEKLRVGGSDITLGSKDDPSDARDFGDVIADQLRSIAKDTGFALVPHRDPATGLTVYQLGYKPRLRGRPLSAEEREGRFVPNPGLNSLPEIGFPTP